MSVLETGSTAPASLYDEARKEAEIHKWIESQKHGRDLGERAIDDWYRTYWMLFCRHRRMEHLCGRRQWFEFSDEKFGRLYSLIVAGDVLVDRILDRVYAGYENLEIINWALDWGLPMPRVVFILEAVDVNRARLDPRSRGYN